MARTSQAKAKKTTAPKDEKPEDRGPYVLVSAARPRRRAGFRFGPEPVKLYEADLDEAKWKAIQADPLLKIAEPED